MNKDLFLKENDIIDLYGKQLRKIRIELFWNASTDDDIKYDLDLSAFMLNKSFKLPDFDFFVYYNARKKKKDTNDKDRPISKDEAVWGAIDELEGDNPEEMLIELFKVDESIENIILVVTIHKGNGNDQHIQDLHFGLIPNCYIKIFNCDNGEEIGKYLFNFSKADFKSEKRDAFEFGNLYRDSSKYPDRWKFQCIEEATSGSLPALFNKYYQPTYKKK